MEVIEESDFNPNISKGKYKFVLSTKTYQKYPQNSFLNKVYNLYWNLHQLQVLKMFQCNVASQSNFFVFVFDFFSTFKYTSIF